jgi:hypothetical protein
MVSIDVVDFEGSGTGSFQAVEVHSLIAGGGGKEFMISFWLVDSGKRPL